jgi:hypothetical protein
LPVRKGTAITPGAAPTMPPSATRPLATSTAVQPQATHANQSIQEGNNDCASPATEASSHVMPVETPPRPRRLPDPVPVPVPVLEPPLRSLELLLSSVSSSSSPSSPSIDVDVCLSCSEPELVFALALISPPFVSPLAPPPPPPPPPLPLDDDGPDVSECLPVVYPCTFAARSKTRGHA